MTLAAYCQIDTMQPTLIGESFMAQMRPLDPAFPIDRQLEIDASSVVLVNIFTVDPAEEQALLDAWKGDAEIMQRLPGYISTQLHRAVGDSPMYLNYAVWESTALFRAAFANPDFRPKAAAYPPPAVASPHLFQKVAVSGLCVS